MISDSFFRLMIIFREFINSPILDASCYRLCHCTVWRTCKFSVYNIISPRFFCCVSTEWDYCKQLSTRQPSLCCVLGCEIFSSWPCVKTHIRLSVRLAIMSKATKRKHVTREVEEDLILPEPDQTIVKVKYFHKCFMNILWRSQ